MTSLRLLPAAMSREQANRILDAVRYGDAQPTTELITRALRASGDLVARPTLHLPWLPPPRPVQIGVWVVRDGWVDLRRAPV